MKKSILLLLLLAGFTSQTTFAQNITGVKYSLFKNEYDNVRLKIKPVSFDGYASEGSASSGVYAALICYTLKGKQYQKFQDMTYDFQKEGEYNYTFSYGNVEPGDVSVNVTFFRRDKPRETYPSKTDCNGGGLTSINTFRTSSSYN